MLMQEKEEVASRFVWDVFMYRVMVGWYGVPYSIRWLEHLLSDNWSIQNVSNRSDTSEHLETSDVITQCLMKLAGFCVPHCLYKKIYSSCSCSQLTVLLAARNITDNHSCKIIFCWDKIVSSIFFATIDS